MNLLDQIKDAEHRVNVTMSVHYDQAEVIEKKNNMLKKLDIGLTAISTIGFLTNVISNQTLAVWVAGICSALALAINLYTRSYNFEKESLEHKKAGDDLWEIREKYRSLLADYQVLSLEEARKTRDELQKTVAVIYKKYPRAEKKDKKKKK